MYNFNVYDWRYVEQPLGSDWLTFNKVASTVIVATTLKECVLRFS